MNTDKFSTQLSEAVAGRLTQALKAVARDEQVPPERLRELVASGRAIIPANVNHTALNPIGIGSDLRTKVNANIGNSSVSSNLNEELSKLEIAGKYGADTVMDLSTGEALKEIRSSMLESCRMPLGTVPIYEAACQVDNTTDITADLLLQVVEEQARQGVDYMTIHAGILLEHLPLTEKRKLGIVSRGGALLARWMQHHGQENPFYTHFSDLLQICRRHDVTLSLGDGLRPGCLADSSDEAQFAELEALGKMVTECRKAEVQCMVEGPGHIPLNEIRMNMEQEEKICNGAPFYVLGPVVSDCAPGYDHITGAIGGALGAFYGAAMLCYVTPKEHLGLPNEADVREGLTAFRLAAHSADVARGIPAAQERDDRISEARSNFDWETQFRFALDPDKARELRQEALDESAHEPTGEEGTQNDNDEENQDYCTMCGPKFCPMRTPKK